MTVSILIALTIVTGCDEGKSELIAQEGPNNSQLRSGIMHPASDPPIITDDEFERLYLEIRDEIEKAGPIVADKPGEGRLAKIEAQLRQITEQAKDAHLRANASVLLGSVFENRKDLRSAISFYRQATMFVPQEASTHAVLALTLAANNDFEAAQAEQERVTELVPNDLQGWLLLGEISLKAEMKEKSVEAYAGYEMRRRGLLEGLTGKSEGVYKIPANERLECARALVVARDNGTALGLLYAMQSESDPLVRAEIVRVMGEQRLLGYEKGLKQQAKIEEDAKVKEQIKWALFEIHRDPVDTSPAAQPPVPESPNSDHQVQESKSTKIESKTGTLPKSHLEQNPKQDLKLENQDNQTSRNSTVEKDSQASSTTGASFPK